MKHRSTTFVCGVCGKCHTFYGKEADDIHKANSALCELHIYNDFWSKNIPCCGITKIITSLFTCCYKPALTEWKYKVLEDEQ